MQAGRTRPRAVSVSFWIRPEQTMRCKAALRSSFQLEKEVTPVIGILVILTIRAVLFLALCLMHQKQELSGKAVTDAAWAIVLPLYKKRVWVLEALRSIIVTSHVRWDRWGQRLMAAEAPWHQQLPGHRNDLCSCWMLILFSMA